ncbi:hypothetical protein RD110_18740 [Rhodoferax koreense]|uniref:Uncharacterized protein n=1 Tax=Rhodoferax koreensis TaxID=1842727 RepID=A0A1P8JZ08_9BURK|nr:hypothetical protein [Rhodoferax koreense]APW38992.1 hypothetical protein RD110_18740 [Rhodoferax koreense]
MHSVHAVQTSAHVPEADLFGDPIRPPAVHMALHGRLTQDAVVRVQGADHGHARPVLCLDLDHVGPGLHQVHVEQPFEASHRIVADAAALKLKRGMWVSVEAPLTGARWTLPNAVSIVPVPSPPKVSDVH